MFLSIASFAISLGGLVPILFFQDRIKQVALAIIISALIVTSGVKLFDVYSHEELISRVENEMLEKLSVNTWTFDQIYNELHYVTFPIANEALFRSVESGRIGHNIVEFRNASGEILQVKGYFVISEN